MRPMNKSGLRSNSVTEERTGGPARPRRMDGSDRTERQMDFPDGISRQPNLGQHVMVP